MARPKLPADQKRIQMSVRLRPDIASWIQDQVRAMRFKDATHALEFAVVRLMEDDLEAAAGVPQKASPDPDLADAVRRHASASKGAGSRTESTRRQ